MEEKSFCFKRSATGNGALLNASPDPASLLLRMLKIANDGIAKAV